MRHRPLHQSHPVYVGDSSSQSKIAAPVPAIMTTFQPAGKVREKKGDKKGGEGREGKSKSSNGHVPAAF